MFASSHPRYRGKPLLLLLEKYVLWAIGELPERDAAKLEELTPNLQATFKRGGNWQSMIANEMGFGPNIQDSLIKMWKKNLEIARQNRVILTAQKFAEMVCDENLQSEENE
jgi:hypothetical protein